MLARRSRQRLLLAAASLGSLALLALAGWVFLAYRIDPKGCDGNYIASHYVPMRNFSCSARPALNARYTLLLHRDQDDAAKDDEFKGIPVLFLPGNAGNFKQVRTFANVAQRMRDWKRDDGAFGIPFLDIYAIDTDEELCAFSEAALVNQAIYASEAIAYILSLYSSIPDGPRSVYVVGHSMGGFVARLIPVQAALMPDSPFRKGSIEAILTLSSPHNHPPAPLSRGMANLYRTVNQQWRSMAPSVANITIASVAGGRKDLILNSVLTELDGVVDPSRGVHAYSTALTGVWASTDHEGSVWCNQLLETVAEAIYDMRNPQLPYRTAPPETRMQTLHRYFNASLDRTIGEPKPMSARSTKYKVISKPVITATLRDDDDINNHLLDLPLLHMQLNASAASKSKASISPPRPVIRILTNSSQLSQQVDPFLQYENPVTKVMPRIPFRSRLVPLATTAPFEILFFWRSSPRAATRPAWTLFELDTRDAVPANATDISLYTDVGSLSHGFLETSIADAQDPVTVKVSSLGLIFGFFKMIDTPGMMTRIVFPRVTDSHLKYHMQIVPECNETPLFQSFIEYSAPPSLDSKFTANISDVLVSWYSNPTHRKPSAGLQVSLYTSAPCRRARLRFKVHWIASLAPLVGDYATFLPSAIVAAMLMYAAEWQSASSQSGKAQSFEGTVLGSYQRIIRILFAVDIAYPILASLGVLPKTLFLGPRDVFVNIFGITFWFSISTGVLLTLFYAMTAVVFLASNILGRVLRPLYFPQRSTALGVGIGCVATAAAVLGPSRIHVVEVALFAYALGACAAATFAASASTHSMTASSLALQPTAWTVQGTRLMLMLSVVSLPVAALRCVAAGWGPAGPGYDAISWTLFEVVSCRRLGLVGAIAFGPVLGLPPFWGPFASAGRSGYATPPMSDAMDSSSSGGSSSGSNSRSNVRDGRRRSGNSNASSSMVLGWPTHTVVGAVCWIASIYTLAFGWRWPMVAFEMLDLVLFVVVAVRLLQRGRTRAFPRRVA